MIVIKWNEAVKKLIHTTIALEKNCFLCLPRELLSSKTNTEDMGKINGKQLYGFSRQQATLKMSGCPELKALNLKKKFAFNYISKESF
ncbi:MAG: hypothetical protein ACTSVZ_11965 [Promethearchaeota archaeon]